MRRVAPPVAQGGSDVRVIASIYPLYDWTLNVAGARTNTVSVTLLQRGGADFHSFQPSADDIRAIKSCSLFIHVGGVSDAWCEKVSVPSSLALMDILPARDMDFAPCDCHAEHAHAHDHAATGKQQNALDEHIWLSLVDAQKCVAAIAERLAAIDPDGAGEYRANAASYIAELRKLDALFREKAALRGSKPLLFADRFPFARLADDYSLNCIAACRGCCADAEASFHTISHLAEEIDEHDISTIFILKEGTSRLAEAVRAATSKRSARIVPLDSMQGLPSASYLQTMRETLDAMF